MSQNREPMIKLDGSGKAPIISYNVPEPTSYNGRNYIDLQFPDSYFVQQAPKSAIAGVTKFATEPTAAIAGFSPASEITLEQVQAEVTQLLAEAKGPFTTALQNLDWNEVLLMRRAGKKLVLSRTMLGDLTYDYVDETAASGTVLSYQPTGRVNGAIAAKTASLTAAPLIDDVNRRPVDEEEPEIPETALEILSPADGSTLQGSHTGVTVTFQGRAYATNTRVTKVWVKVGNGVAQDATSTAGITWSTWTYTTTLTQSGPVQITIGANAARGYADVQTLTLNVVLAPAPDTTAPTVTVLAPVNGEVLTAPAANQPLPIVVRGTASDDRGVQTVELQVNNEAFAPAVPTSTGNWSSWTRALSLPAGTHRLTVRCSDRAGNVSTAIVGVTVKTPAPVDTTNPTLSITSHRNKERVSGTFDGAKVVLQGTANDAGGIRHVTVSVDDSPTPLTAEMATAGWATWRCPITLKQPGNRFITVTATDMAGNETRQVLEVIVDLSPDLFSRNYRLMLVESYQLSSYLGNYGAGRTIKTFSLLPGEKTRLSIKTYTRTEAEAKQAASILDSVTEESVTDFTRQMEAEQANKRNFGETRNYNVEGSASASWGWGSAKVTAGASGGTTAAREEFAKNISSATQKHVAKASAKRDLQINTTYEVKTQSGEETAIEREIENINVSRTLNFVFRQMNQEFITLLHLVDVRIGFYHVGRKEYTEVTLPQLQSLLEQVIVPEKVAEVKNDILRQLMNIFDYQDLHHSFVEEKPLVDSQGKTIDSYLRIKKDYTSRYADPATGSEFLVPGIILAANKYVMRTEGIIVEAILGQGDGLDDYSHGLQDEAVRAKQLDNALAAAELEKRQLGIQIIATRDPEAAKLYEQVFGARPAIANKPAEPNKSTNGVAEVRNGQISHI